WAPTYAHFMAAALVLGVAGGMFVTGIAFVSRWYPKERHGAAFGIFGAGNVGAAVTNFGAPFLLVAIGWQGTARVYALGMVVAAILFYVFTREDPETQRRRREGVKGTTLAAQLEDRKSTRLNSSHVSIS